MDETRVNRRKETAEVFTPWSLLDIMTKNLTDEDWKDPNKTFLDNSCGNGQIILYVLDKKLANGSTYIQALSTIYGLDFMEDNIIECKKRIFNMLDEKKIKYSRKKVQEIIDHNIVCHDALTGWDYENWCPEIENTAKPLF